MSWAGYKLKLDFIIVSQLLVILSGLKKLGLKNFKGNIFISFKSE